MGRAVPPNRPTRTEDRSMTATYARNRDMRVRELEINSRLNEIDVQIIETCERFYEERRRLLKEMADLQIDVARLDADAFR